MPRIAGPRHAAEPTSVEQRARHLRILQAAEQLGAETDLDHVQMHEVARRARVAIGTLYRYFPSKTHLFVGVMVYLIEQTGRNLRSRPKRHGTPADRVYDVLVRANRALLSRPHLATSMMNSVNTANAARVTDVARVESATREVVLFAAGIEQPTEYDLRIVRVLLQAWGGILLSALNGRLSFEDAEGDLRLACQLMMAGASESSARLAAV